MELLVENESGLVFRIGYTWNKVYVEVVGFNNTTSTNPSINKSYLWFFKEVIKSHLRQGMRKIDFLSFVENLNTIGKHHFSENVMQEITKDFIQTVRYSCELMDSQYKS